MCDGGIRVVSKVRRTCRTNSSIKQSVTRVLGAHVDFNEILSVTYRDGQKMAWHDDGEPGGSHARTAQRNHH